MDVQVNKDIDTSSQHENKKRKRESSIILSSIPANKVKFFEILFLLFNYYLDCYCYNYSS
jgi:hypothetical protein